MKSCMWPATWSSGAKEAKTKRLPFIRLSPSTARFCRYGNVGRWRMSECALAKKYSLAVFKQRSEMGLVGEIQKDEFV